MATNAPTENHADQAPAVQTNGMKQEPFGAVVGVDSKLPTRKDASLKEFLGKMDDYAPIVSRAVPPPSPTPLVQFADRRLFGLGR